MPEQTLKAAQEAMDRAIAAVGREFATVRTGKASPAILDSVKVEAYGSLVELKQVANVGAPEPQMLLVQPYDPNIAGVIANAIQNSDLGLNPSADGGVVRVPIPPLTEERRLDFVKVLHRMAEEGKVSLRHARHEARDTLHAQQKDGAISEDEARRAEDRVQEITDGHSKRIDEMLARKEAEVMEV
ncbi:MAG: ribosome recycling factor [Gemmatimonadota bacterium]|nr:ribosome recycling factor [Gemmatimonadota bacterium]